MPLTTVKVIVFPGGFNLPLWTAIERHFFEQCGIAIDLSYTPNSVEQLAGLISGRWDIALTGFDNIVAYQEGQGEAEIDIEPNLFAFMGGDSAFLRLLVQPDISSYRDLKGKTLSVDALTTGFAFVLRKMLTLNGLSETDVRFERAGGVLQRFEALKAKKHSGTLVITPFELIGRGLGFRVLQSASDIFPHYQGISGATRRDWADKHQEVLIEFIRAYVRALRWLYDPGNRQAAVELLSSKLVGFTRDLADATCEVLLTLPNGFDPLASLDVQGVSTVLKLRSEFGRPRKTLIDPERYVDLRFYQAAMAHRA